VRMTKSRLFSRRLFVKMRQKWSMNVAARREAKVSVLSQRKAASGVGELYIRKLERLQKPAENMKRENARFSRDLWFARSAKTPSEKLIRDAENGSSG